MKKIISVLQAYGHIQDKKVNKEKRVFFMHQNAAATHKKLVGERTGCKFSLKYLGCPIYHARKRKIHYACLIQTLSQGYRL